MHLPFKQKVRDRIIQTAENNKIPFQRHASSRYQERILMPLLIVMVVCPALISFRYVTCTPQWRPFIKDVENVIRLIYESVQIIQREIALAIMTHNISTTSGFNKVDIPNCLCSPAAIFRKILRIIFPLRVIHLQPSSIRFAIGPIVLETFLVSFSMVLVCPCP